MRHLNFASLLFAFALTSCATMSAEEKGQYLEQYRQIADARQQRAFDGPHGVKDQYRAQIKSDGNSARGKKIMEKLVFTEKTGHGLDTLRKLLVDAEVRAMNDVYTGEQVRYWVDFYQGERGKKMLKAQDRLRREMDAEIAANPGKDHSAARQRYSAGFTAASESIAHHFEAGVGRAVIEKQDEFNATRHRYKQKAHELYNKKLNAAITAHNQKSRQGGAKGKSKKSH